MATITDTTTDANGNIIVDVSSSADDSIALATAGTYFDKNIIFNIKTFTDPILQEKSVTPSTATQEVIPDAGYDGLSKVNVEAMSIATQATPSVSIDSSGLITATATQTAGYVEAGTKSATKQLAFQTAKTITPTTTSQIAVSSGYYTGGTVTVKGDSNLVAENIKSGVSIFGVNGTYEGNSGGGNTDIEDSIINRTITNYTNDRVTSIGSYAFYGCSSLTSVSFLAATTIGSGAFEYCSSLTSVSFPTAKSIGSHAFAHCSSLTSVSFPAATSIGSGAFYNCSSLTSVNFPAATSIGKDAFYNCFSLTSVNFPTAKSIGSYAFCDCYSLTSVNFPAATSIGSYTFYRCSKLTSVNFPAVTTIGSSAFYNCYSLTSVNFPAVTTTEIDAFAYCSSLTSISFPAATSIGNGAFRYCSSLTSVSFPTAKSISGYAFMRCFKLTELFLMGSSLCKLSASNAFSSTPIGGYSKVAGKYGSIYVPASLLESYKKATNWTYFSNRFVGI